MWIFGTLSRVTIETQDIGLGFYIIIFHLNVKSSCQMSEKSKIFLFLFPFFLMCKILVEGVPSCLVFRLKPFPETVIFEQELIILDPDC